MFDSAIAENNTDRRPWAETVRTVCDIKLPYMDHDAIHAELLTQGWTSEESHFIIQSAEFRFTQRSSGTWSVPPR